MKLGSTFLSSGLMLIFAAASVMVATFFDAHSIAQAKVAYTWSAKWRCQIYGIDGKDGQSEPGKSTNIWGRFEGARSQEACNEELRRAENVCAEASSQLASGYGNFLTGGCNTRSTQGTLWDHALDPPYQNNHPLGQCAEGQQPDGAGFCQDVPEY